MPKPHRKSKQRKHAVNKARAAKRAAHSKPFPLPLTPEQAQAAAETSVLTGQRAPINPASRPTPAAPKRVPVTRTPPAPSGVYLEGASLTPEQEERARELGYTVNADGRWYRPEGD